MPHELSTGGGGAYRIPALLPIDFRATTRHIDQNIIRFAVYYKVYILIFSLLLTFEPQPAT